MLTFTDEHTREVTVYFMAKKSDAFEAYKMFEAWVSVHRNAKIKILRTDRGGEFVSKAFQKHVTISDLAIFNFFSLLYDVAYEVSPTWLTPVYLRFAQVAVT